MHRQHRAVWGILVAIAGLTVVPARAQEQAPPAAQEASADTAPTAAGAPADAQAPLQATLQTEPARARMSMAEKAAAVTGAVATGIVTFKGLSALFKSGKKQAAPAAPAPAN